MELTGSLLGGRYRVGKMLGRGGMAAVYEAVQEGIDRKVALKIVHAHIADDPSIRERFKREARAVATIRHPNVVQINDYVEQPGAPPFLVMERLQGETLRDVIGRTPKISPQRLVHVALQVLSALDAAHRANVVHRDLKPENVFLEQTTAQRDLVKLLDFGIAKFIGEADDAIKLTRVGHAIGTPAFMAPEQALGDPVDGRSDLYALGATMFVALTGCGIYDTPNAPADLTHAILTHRPPLVTSLRPDVDPRLAGVIARALEKKPSARFASAMEMARALSGLATDATLVSAQGPVHDTVRDPIVNALPVVAPRAPTSSSMPLIVAVVLVGGLVLAGTGLSAAFYVFHSRSPPAAAVTYAPPATVAPVVSLEPTPSSDSIPPLSDPPATVSAVATKPPPPPPPPPTPLPTSSTNEPHECAAARQMKAQGQERQAAQLALRCIRRGGQPPF